MTTNPAGLFPGFDEPHEHWSKLPHALIDQLPAISTMAELKVILYVLRHTWGNQDYEGGRRITLDEFSHGRKQRDGTRIDAGTGLSPNRGLQDRRARGRRDGRAAASPGTTRRRPLRQSMKGGDPFARRRRALPVAQSRDGCDLCLWTRGPGAL